jgi:fibronectin-binding autotransporter adhesin
MTPRILVHGIAAILTLTPAVAATFTWDGGAASDNWSLAGNWNPDGAPPDVGTDDLIFNVNVGLAPIVDAIDGSWAIYSLTFGGSAGAFVIGGTNLLVIFGGGVTNNGTETQTITNDITTVGTTWSAAAGALIFGDAVNGRSMNLFGSDPLIFGGSSNTTIYSNLIGTPGSLFDVTKNGSGTLTFSLPSGVAAYGSNYTGTTTINEGTIILNQTVAGGVIGGNLVIGDGTGGAGADIVRLDRADQITETVGRTVTINSSGLLDLNGFTDTIHNLTMNGGTLTNTGAGLLVLNGSLNLIAAATGATISGGNLLLNGGTKTISVADGSPANDLDLNVVIAGSGIIKTGTGRMRLGKANTFTGGFTLQAGSIALADDGALGTAPATFAAGTVTVDTGDIGTSTRTIGNAINVTGSVTVTTTPVLGLFFTGPVSGTGSINYTGTGDLSFTGSVATFTLNGGTFGGVAGSTLTTNAFTYNAGAFNGRLNVLGTAVFNSDFTAGNGMQISGAPTLAAGRTLTLNGAGLANEGTLTLSGGTLAGGGPLANNSLINGNGIIAGSGGFTNNSLITQSGGNLTLSNSGANVNNGNIDMVTGFQFRLAGANLTNSGSINLRGATLTGTGTLTNSGGGTITGRGTITAPFINGPGGSLLVSDGTTNVIQSFTNAGILRLTSFSAALVGGTITNSGVITGEGTMANPFNNAGGGEVRGESGKTLYLPGVTGPNAGRLNLLGGTLQFAQQFTNSTTGQINGHGVVNFAAGLTNSGQINFSGGLAEVFGTVNLLAGSRVITSGGGDSIFYGAVTHNGTEVRTSAGAQTVFFGLVNGAGPFTGTGTVYMEGGYSPGNSPAAVTLDTELIFGDAATLTLELGGLAAGSGYDQLVLEAGGSLVLDGALVLDLINGFTPAAGDSFAVFDFAPGQLTGGFDEILLADALPAGLSFDTTQLTTTGRIGVVPEPGAAALLLTGCAFLGLHRRSRK